MGMTLTEKILARHAGRERVAPGELIQARVDLALGNDVTSPIAIQAFRSLGAGAVFDRERIALVPDHFAPNKDIKSAEQVKTMREFAKEFGIVNYFEVGRMGIEHVLLPDEGLVVPGDLVIGADSHTCTYGALCAFSTGVGSTDLAAAMLSGEVWLKVPETLRVVLSGRPAKWVEGKDVILHIIGKIGVDGALYRAMEYTGDGIAHLSMAWRFTVANMAIEAGAKNGIFPFDAATKAYADGRAKRKVEVVTADPGARYADEISVDLSALEPVVAFPHLPENTRPLSMGSAEAPPSVTSTPPWRTKSPRFWIPDHVKPPVMSGEDVGVPWLGNCAVFVYARGPALGSMPVAMAFRLLLVSGNRITSKRVRRPPLRTSSSITSVYGIF